MLNKNDESGHPCLVPDLRGKALRLSPSATEWVYVVVYLHKENE